jgi:hypothetical protein
MYALSGCGHEHSPGNIEACLRAGACGFTPCCDPQQADPMSWCALCCGESAVPGVIDSHDQGRHENDDQSAEFMSAPAVVLMSAPHECTVFFWAMMFWHWTYVLASDQVTPKR